MSDLEALRQVSASSCVAKPLATSEAGGSRLCGRPSHGLGPVGHRRTHRVRAFGLLLLLIGVSACSSPVVTDTAPTTTMSAPDATLMDIDGNEVALVSLWAEGPTILVFYRGHW